MFCCLRNCFDGLGFTSVQIVKREPNPIALDTTHMGKPFFQSVFNIIMDVFTVKYMFL